MRKYIIYTIAVLVIILAGFFIYSRFEYPFSNGPVLENAENDLIKVVRPIDHEKISSPLKVSGQARGTWYFEASFPIIIVDWDGRIIGEGHAEAKSDWMTTDFVPFEGTVSFERPAYVQKGTYSERGAVIFKKDNPSGDPKNDAAVEIPVIFE